MNEETDHPAGRELFVSKCNSCHQLHNPHQFSEAEWDSLLVVMKRKAKINEEQRNEIFSWIMGIKNKHPVKTETIQK
jgi:mono/diheme cytochrome c family protein